MAKHLAGAGPLLLWNRTERVALDLAAELSERGEVRVATLSELDSADILFSCLPTSAEVSETMRAAKLKRGAIWIDCSSGHPAAAREQARELTERGVAFLDAPVSGGTVGAQAGTLTVMVGGDAQVLERARPHFHFAGLLRHMGPNGSGFAVKTVNNTLLASQLLAAGEGLALLTRCGVDLSAALEVINASSGRSNATQNLIPQRVLTREFPLTFRLGLLAKDANTALDVALQERASTPLLAQVAALTRGAAQLIGPDEDHSAALRLAEALNGVELK